MKVRASNFAQDIEQGTIGMLVDIHETDTWHKYRDLIGVKIVHLGGNDWARISDNEIFIFYDITVEI